MVPPVEGEVALKFELCKLTHGSDGMEPTEEQTVALRRWAGNTYSIVSMTGEAELKLARWTLRTRGARSGRSS